MDKNNLRLYSAMSKQRKAALREGVRHLLKIGITPGEFVDFLSDRMYWVYYVHNKRPDFKFGDTLWHLRVLMEEVAVRWVEGKGSEADLIMGLVEVCQAIGPEGVRECLGQLLRAWGFECSEEAFETVKTMGRLMPGFCALSNLVVCLNGYDEIMREEMGLNKP